MAATMSDDELRKKLIEHGYDAGPITPNTRLVYMKKLNELEAEKKKNAFKSQAQKPLATRSLLTFSSDESETESQSPNHDLKSTRKLRRRRQSLQPHGGDSTGANGLYSSRRENEKKLSPSYSPSSSSSSSFVSGGGSASATYKYLGLGNPITNAASSSSSTPTRSRNLRNSLHFDSSGTDSDNITDGFSERSDGLKSSRYTLSNSIGGSTPKHKFYTGLDGPLSGRTSTFSSSSFNENNVGGGGSSGLLLSSKKNYDFVSPTSQLRKKDSIVVTPTANGSNDIYFRSQFRNVDSPVPNSITNSHCISMILLGFVILFFVVLGVLYLGVRHKDKSLQPALPDCHEKEQKPCDKKDNSEQVLAVVNLMRNQLRYVAGIYDCSRNNNPELRRMTVAEMKNFLKDNEVTIREPYENTTFGVSLKVFAEHTVLLGIRLYNRDNILTSNISEAHWLDSVHGDKSFFCRLKQAFGVVLYQLFLGAAVIVAIILISIGSYWHWKKNKDFHKQVMAMTESILCEVQKNYEASLTNPEIKPYLAIPHVRDMLIPISERKHKLPIWERAVKFLNSHDSRVRVECQTIEGEEFEVWRWLQPQALRENSKKLWQGQAFENLDTGLNAHIHSPTQCLKIRNMFDPDVEYGDNWHVHIQDAILEKCEGINGIVHIKVDTSSREGCVYVKCNSPTVAGQVFRALHGWWFDGNLVTVRYLRLERYHERFPEAANAKLPLKPSNNKRLSLGLPMFKSFMEH